MRIVFLILATLAALPSTAFAQDAAAPVRVGERAFTVAELKAAQDRGLYAPGQGAEWVRRGAADWLILNEWDAREAAQRGIVVPQASIDAVMAEARRESSEIGWPDEEALRELPAEVEQGIRRDLLIDAITREAGPGPAAFGRAFDALAARERVVTACRAAYFDPRRNLCGNQRRQPGGCAIFGRHDICAFDFRGHRTWELVVYPVDEVYDASVAAGEPDPTPANNRLYAYLRSHSPGAFRRCWFEEDDWHVSFTCPARADAIAVAYAATRIHQHAKTHWTVPANGVL